MKSKSLWLLDYDKEGNKVLSQERIPIGHRIRDIVVSPRGKILLATDDQKIIKLSLSNKKIIIDVKKINFLDN